jgi:hypothetical protein
LKAPTHVRVENIEKYIYAVYTKIRFFYKKTDFLICGLR